MGLSKQQFANIPYDFKVLIDGNTWTYSTDLEIAANTTVNFHILTGDCDVIINIAQAEVFGTETAFVGYSDSTVAANGTEVFPKNHNRQSDKVSKTRLFSAPTITDDGDEISNAVAFAANQPGKAILADTSILSKYILNQRSSNVLRIINRSTTAATKVSIVLDYVEVDL